MNCHETQSCLLEIEKTDPIPQEIEEHLRECEECTSFQQNWRLVEQQIPMLPVPRPQRRDSFIAEFLSQPVEPAILSFASSSTSDSTRKKERTIRKIAFALAVASALLICVLGWWFSELWTYTPAPQPRIAKKTELEEHLEKNPEWKAAKNPEERFLVLVKETEQILDPIHEKLSWEESRRDLFRRARLFEQMVQHKIIREAEQMTPEQRRKNLPDVIKKLQSTESQSLRAATELPPLAEPLTLIATTARKGEERLRQLLAAV